MKKIRLIVSSIVFAVAVCVVTVPASAQALDEEWFALKISVKGYQVGAGEEIGKASYKLTSYLYMIWDVGSSHYDCMIFNETAPGVWSSPSGIIDNYIDPEFCTEEYIFVPHRFLAVSAPGGISFGMYITAVIRTKLDTLDELSSAKLTVLSAEVPIGLAPGAIDIYGGAKIKAKLVAEEKLPFVPAVP